MCTYIKHVCRQRIEFIPLSLSPLHLPFRRPFHSASLSLSLPSSLALCLSLSLSLRGPVTSRGSSIQIAFPLGILNLWHARCALLILDHAYASWILQRSPKGPKGYCAFSTPFSRSSSPLLCFLCMYACMSLLVPLVSFISSATLPSLPPSPSPYTCCRK